LVAGLERTAGWATDATGSTSVTGVWAAGNVVDPRAQVITAAGAGSTAAIAINSFLEKDIEHGRHRLTSDADVASMPGGPLDLLAESGLADLLAQALRVPTVDLVDLRRAPLRLRGRVLAEGRLLYSADEPGRVAFEVRTRSEYFDFLPTQRAHRDEFLRRVAAEGLNG
jgi:hypothetical protein